MDYLTLKSNIDRFISCGIDAFHGYSIYNYFYQGKDYDKKLYLAIELLVKETGKSGILYADSEKVNGFAQWFPPGFTGHSIMSYIYYGVWKYLFMTDFIGTFNRMCDVEDFSFKKKAEFTQNEDIFLYNLAVRKSMQKKGISSKLVRPMLEYAKTINRPCYLETYDPENVALYEHMGFKSLPSTKMTGTSVTHYPLIYKVD